MIEQILNARYIVVKVNEQPLQQREKMSKKLLAEVAQNEC